MVVYIICGCSGCRSQRINIRKWEMVPTERLSDNRIEVGEVGGLGGGGRGRLGSKVAGSGIVTGRMSQSPGELGWEVRWPC